MRQAVFEKGPQHSQCWHKDLSFIIVRFDCDLFPSLTHPSRISRNDSQGWSSTNSLYRLNGTAGHSQCWTRS